MMKPWLPNRAGIKTLNHSVQILALKENNKHNIISVKDIFQSYDNKLPIIFIQIINMKTSIYDITCLIRFTKSHKVSSKCKFLINMYRKYLTHCQSNYLAYDVYISEILCTEIFNGKIPLCYGKQFSTPFWKKNVIVFTISVMHTQS